MISLPKVILYTQDTQDADSSSVILKSCQTEIDACCPPQRQMEVSKAQEKRIEMDRQRKT